MDNWMSRVMGSKVATLLLLLPAVGFSADGRLMLDGILRVKGGELSDARMVMVDHLGNCVVLTSGLDHFTLSLELNSEYLLEFTKTGHVTKQILVDTRVPTGDYVFREFGFPFQVTLSPSPKTGSFEYMGPVAQVHFVAGIDDFGYDKDYRVKPMPVLMAMMERERTRVNAGGAPAPAIAVASSAAEPVAPVEAQRAVPEPAVATAPEVVPAATAEKMPAAPNNTPEVGAPVEAPVWLSTSEAPASGGTRVEEEERTMATPSVPVATAAPVSDFPKVGSVVRDHPAMQRERVPQDLPSPRMMEADREEDVVVEQLRVTRIIRIREQGTVTEYRRVSHRYGQVTHFRDGAPCSEQVFEQAVGK